MGQPIEQCAGEALVAECGRPLVEGQVGGDDCGAALIAGADQLEQQLSAGLGERHEAQFVDDQEFDSGHLPLQAQQPALVPGLNHLMDDGGGRDEAGFDAALAGGKAEPDGDVGLPHARRPKGDDVLPTADELAPGQVQDQLLVERRDGVEVEALQALDRREAGRLDASVDHARLPVEQLQFDQPGQIADVIDVLPRALPGELLVFPEHRRQLQLLQVVLEQDLRGFAGRAHVQAPAVSAM